MQHLQECNGQHGSGNVRRGDVRQHLEHAVRGCSKCCAAHANAATARCDGMARSHASASLAHAVRALEHVPTEREPSFHHPAAHSMGHALQWLYLQTRAAIEHEHASEKARKQTTAFTDTQASTVHAQRA
jgi:hypothetical protein